MVIHVSCRYDGWARQSLLEDRNTGPAFKTFAAGAKRLLLYGRACNWCGHVQIMEVHATGVRLKGGYLYMSVRQSWAMLSLPPLKSPVMVKLLSNPDKANPFRTTSSPLASTILPSLVLSKPVGEAKLGAHRRTRHQRQFCCKTATLADGHAHL